MFRSAKLPNLWLCLTGYGPHSMFKSGYRDRLSEMTTSRTPWLGITQENDWADVDIWTSQQSEGGNGPFRLTSISFSITMTT